MTPRRVLALLVAAILAGCSSQPKGLSAGSDAGRTLAAAPAWRLTADARLMAAESRIGRMVSEAALLTVEKSRTPRLRLTTLEGERLWFEGIPLPGTPRG